MNAESFAEKVDWLFFDLGNTLVDEGAVWEIRVRQLAAVLRDNGWPYDESQILATIYSAAADRAPSPFYEAVRRLVDDAARVKEIARQARYEKHLERLYPESLPTIERLSRKALRQACLPPASAIGTTPRVDNAVDHN